MPPVARDRLSLPPRYSKEKSWRLEDKRTTQATQKVFDIGIPFADRQMVEAGTGAVAPVARDRLRLPLRY